MSNEINPYEAPTFSGGRQTAITNPPRKAALIHLRLALAILLIPAIYNYCCFDFVAFRNEETPAAIVFVLFSRIINIGGMLVVSLLVWFFGLAILEIATKWLHYLFSRHSKLEQWKTALYDILDTVVYFAAAGALIWLAWVIGFYNLQMDFYAISWPIGILANLVAAGLYLRLAFRWYEIEKAAQGTR